jgi:hypothetical protein
VHILDVLLEVLLFFCLLAALTGAIAMGIKTLAAFFRRNGNPRAHRIATAYVELRMSLSRGAHSLAGRLFQS